MTSPDAPRHKPGTVYSCDARRYGADRNLCPLHAAAPEMVALLQECAIWAEEQHMHRPSTVTRDLATRIRQFLSATTPRQEDSR